MLAVIQIDAVRPHVLIGATGAPGTFTQAVVERMSALNERPVIFALSNPTSRAECTAEQAYSWSGGRAVFTSGSPFAPVSYGAKVLRPGQGNNAYVFPGSGLGAVACRARTLPDALFLAAARTLAGLVEQDELDRTCLYPPLTDPEDLARHRGRRRRDDARDEAGAAAATREPEKEHRGVDVRAVRWAAAAAPCAPRPTDRIAA